MHVGVVHHVPGSVFSLVLMRVGAFPVRREQSSMQRVPPHHHHHHNHHHRVAFAPPRARTCRLATSSGGGVGDEDGNAAVGHLPAHRKGHACPTAQSNKQDCDSTGKPIHIGRPLLACVCACACMALLPAFPWAHFAHGYSPKCEKSQSVSQF